LLNNPFQNYQNQISSSVSYTKSWDNKYNLSVNLNHNQNNNLGLVNMSLPNINFNAITIYPFQSKDQIGAGKWYEKLGIGYNGSFQNQLSFYDSAVNFNKLLDTMQWGAQHSIPISLSLPSLGPVTITPGISFEEKWFGQQSIKTWNNKTKKVDTSISRGFYRAPNMIFCLGTASRIFGTYKFSYEFPSVGNRSWVLNNTLAESCEFLAHPIPLFSFFLFLEVFLLLLLLLLHLFTV
jgi:hypothetical protein